MNKIIAVVVAPVMALIVAGPVRAEAIKEGQWDMTMQMQMEGMDKQMAEANKAMENMSEEEKAMMQQMMGGMKMGPQAGGSGMNIGISQCITNDNPVPQREEDKECQTTHTTRGNKVNFEAICPDSKSTGEITYSNDAMNGVIKSESKAGSVTMNISGKYAGPCLAKVSDEVAKKGQRGVSNGAVKGAMKDAAKSLLGF